MASMYGDNNAIYAAVWNEEVTLVSVEGDK
jgi:hypothetical protein